MNGLERDLKHHRLCPRPAATESELVRAGMKDEYEDAIAPFVGLEQPEPTTSD